MPSVDQKMEPEHQAKAALVQLLATGVQRDDDETWEKIYGELFPLIYSQLVRVIHDPSRAEDLAQEAFVEVWTRRKELNKESGNLRGYSHVIARNLGIDEFRLRGLAQWRRFVDLNEPLAGDEGDSGETLLCVMSDRNARSPEQDLLDRELQEKIRQVLSEGDQLILTLELFYGFSQKEIAGLLGITHGNVRTRRYRALKKLKNAIEGGSLL